MGSPKRKCLTSTCSRSKSWKNQNWSCSGPGQNYSQFLPTQSSLFHARIIDTDVCPLCNLESQSLKHILITCSVSSSFWTCFSNWCHEKFNQKLTLSESTILYDWHKESNNWEVLNYCLIVAKYKVFGTSVRNGDLDFDSCLPRLNKKIDILRNIGLDLTAYRNFKKMGQTSLDSECWCHFHNPYFFGLHFTAALFHL